MRVEEVAVSRPNRLPYRSCQKSRTDTRGMGLRALIPLGFWAWCRNPRHCPEILLVAEKAEGSGAGTW